MKPYNIIYSRCKRQLNQKGRSTGEKSKIWVLERNIVTCFNYKRRVEHRIYNQIVDQHTYPLYSIKTKSSMGRDIYFYISSTANLKSVSHPILYMLVFYGTNVVDLMMYSENINISLKKVGEQAGNMLPLSKEKASAKNYHHRQLIKCIFPHIQKTYSSMRLVN